MLLTNSNRRYSQSQNILQSILLTDWTKKFHGGVRAEMVIVVRNRHSDSSSKPGWVGFYGISTIIDYLMPNLLYTHTLNL